MTVTPSTVNKKPSLFSLSPLRSLKGRLIIFFLAVSLLPLLFAALLLQVQSQRVFQNAASDRLVAVRNLKVRQLEKYFSNLDQDIQLVANFDMTSDAFRQFLTSATRLGPELREVGFLGHPEIEAAETFTPYNLIHAEYHELFSDIVKARGYVDFLLVSRAGDVIYSNAKNDDFGTNLLDGPYQDTHLARLLENLAANPEAGRVYMTDYLPYPPVGNSPISFVGTPIVDEDHHSSGMLIYALPITPIAELMQDNAGLGETGETYLVGEDKMMRSASRFSGESEVDTSPVTKGFTGQTSVELTQNYSGISVLSAYQPVEVSGAKWVLLAEVQESEALGLGVQLRNILWTVIAVTALVVGIGGVAIAYTIANPIISLTETAQQVTAGNLEAQALIESKDEIGQLAQAFNSMTAQMRQVFGSLEVQVEERTTDLALSMEVGQQASAIRNLEDLLPTIAHLIKNRFHLYYTQVFLLDDTGQNLIVKAGTGAAGKEIIARRQALQIGSQTIAGQVAIAAKPIVVSNTENSDIFKPDPLLPNTRSQLAVPLIVEYQVIGVLDLHAEQENIFSDKNLTVFKAMATQLAISIDSARQWVLALEAQEKSKQAIKNLTREAWTKKLGPDKQTMGYTYNLASVDPLEGKNENGGISAPVVVQNQSIGKLSVSTAQKGDLSEDERTLLDAVAQQLAQKAENLRLFEETQQQAAREQMARQITDKIRASRDIETALNTAAEELSNALGTARAVVNLKIEGAETDE